MDRDAAKLLALPLVDKHSCVIVASDGSVYCDPNIDALIEHATDQNLELFDIKLSDPTKKQQINGA